MGKVKVMKFEEGGFMYEDSPMFRAIEENVKSVDYTKPENCVLAAKAALYFLQYSNEMKVHFIRKSLTYLGGKMGFEFDPSMIKDMEMPRQFLENVKKIKNERRGC